MSTLAQLEVRVSTFLYDALNENFPLSPIDEGLRQALHEYSTALPLTKETTITLIEDNNEIALNNLDGLINVVDVWWPYSSTENVWPPNRVTGFRVYWDEAQPVLVINQAGIGLPMTDDEMRVFYTTLHTIQNLDSGTYTSPPVHHESMLVRGAAGYACTMRAVDLTEQLSVNLKAVPDYQAFGKMLIGAFKSDLSRLSNVQRSSEPFGVGWALDKDDTGSG